MNWAFLILKARFVETVVLPVPPLPLATETIIFSLKDNDPGDVHEGVDL